MQKLCLHIFWVRKTVRSNKRDYLPRYWRRKKFCKRKIIFIILLQIYLCWWNFRENNFTKKMTQEEEVNILFNSDFQCFKAALFAKRTTGGGWVLFCLPFYKQTADLVTPEKFSKQTKILLQQPQVLCILVNFWI